MAKSRTVFITIGKKIKEIRELKGLTQGEVAKTANINTNYFACIERGEVNTSLDKLRLIAKALGVKSSEILPF